MQRKLTILPQSKYQNSCIAFPHFSGQGIRHNGRMTDSPPSTPEEALRQRLIRQTFVLGRTTSPAAFAAAILTWGCFLAWNGAQAGILVWAVAIHLIQLLRWLLILDNERRYPEARFADGQPAGLARYLVPLLAASALWGLAPWLLLPTPADSQQQAVMLVILFGMLAGSVPTLSPSRAAIGAWLLPLALIAALYLLLSRQYILTVFLLLFCAVMGKFALVQHRLLRKGLSAQIENSILNQRLTAQSADLARLNRERSRFFASASHDLRQPLHALTLFIQVLRRDLTGHPGLHIAERIHQAAESIGAQLKLMLDVSRMDAGALRPHFAPVSLEVLFERLLQIYEPRAEAAGLSLRVHLTNCQVVSDGDLLLRILSNLTDNAFKYCRQGGVMISVQRRRTHHRLAVWDTGCGIAAQHHAQLFDEFYQVGNPQRDPAQGYGMGLAIVRRLSDLLGARLEMRSIPGRGSVFWLELPLRTAEATALTTRTGLLTPPTQLGLQLLVLDDDPGICEAMRAWLQTLVKAVHIAGSTEEAVAIARREGASLDALIIDFRLPGGTDGVSAARRLWATLGRTLPVILVTGDTSESDLAEARAFGFTILFKPVAPAELLAAVRDRCAGLERRPTAA